MSYFGQYVVPRSDGLYALDNGGFFIKIFDFATGTFTPVEGRIETLESLVAAIGSELAAGGAKPDGAADLLLLDGQGFKAEIVHPDGSSPFFDPKYAPMRTALQATISALDAQCRSWSNANTTNAYNSEMAAIESQYNLILHDGDSQSTSYVTTAAYSTTAKYGNLMIGATVNGWGGGNPPGNSGALNPLVEGPNGSRGESPVSGCLNLFKTLWNRSRAVTNDSTRTLIGTAIGQPGCTLPQLLSGGPAYPSTPPEQLYARKNTLFSDLKSATSGSTLSVLGVPLCIGENDAGTDPATFLADLITYRSQVDALFQASIGQVRQAGVYLSQFGGSFTDDAQQLGNQNALWVFARTQPNVFLADVYGDYPNLGHNTANTFRWRGNMLGKVLFRTAVLRQGWFPLHPLVCKIVGNTLLVGFHVPVGPLATTTAYNPSTPLNFPDLGFSLYDAAGLVPITVAIVAPSVVQITPGRAVAWGTDSLTYGDATNHQGCGNLCDSDALLFEDVYGNPDLDNGQSYVPAGQNYNIAALSGKPYPPMNRCVRFRIVPSTFSFASLPTIA